MRSVKPDSDDSWERKIAKQINYDDIERQGMTDEERRKFREKPMCLQMIEAKKRGERWKGPIRRDSKFYVPPEQKKKKPKEDINPMDILIEQSEATEVRIKHSRSEKDDGSRPKRGRPKGSKDKKPRTRRTQAEVKGCRECEHLMPNGCELSKCHFRKVREEE